MVIQAGVGGIADSGVMEVRVRGLRGPSRKSVRGLCKGGSLTSTVAAVVCTQKCSVEASDSQRSNSCHRTTILVLLLNFIVV